MLTRTPPETHEDEDIQAEDTDHTSTRVGWREKLGKLYAELFLVDTDKIEFDPDSKNNHGFNLIELVIGVVAIAALSVIGFGIYSNVTEDARATALNSNIQLAATNLDAAAALDPNILLSEADIIREMTERTSLSWDADWETPAGTTDEANLVRFELVNDVAGTTADPLVSVSTGVAPTVEWLVDDASAVRLRVSNPQGEWRCALVIIKPSSSALTATKYGTSAVTGPPQFLAFDETDADERQQKAAEMRGLWYDGGDTVAASGLHDCSPVASWGLLGQLATAAATTAANYDLAVPVDSNSWYIGVIAANVAAELDPTSTAISATTHSVRTLHSSVAQLDSNE